MFYGSGKLICNSVTSFIVIVVQLFPPCIYDASSLQQNKTYHETDKLYSDMHEDFWSYFVCSSWNYVVISHLDYSEVKFMLTGNN